MKSPSLVLNSQHFLVFILVSYAVVVSLFVDAGLRNYLVLFAAMTGGILFYPLRLTLYPQAFLAFALFSIMTMLSLFQDGAAGLLSVGLTFVYALGYFAIASLLDRVKDKRAFLMKVMRGVIYAFAMLSIIQMVTSLAGLPVPNQIGGSSFWRHNSLAYEPSQLGRIVGISMLCYLMLSRLPGEPVRTRERQKLLVAFLAAMLLSGSALAAIAIPLVYGLSRSLSWFLLIVMVSVLIWPTALLIDFEPLQRSVLLISKLGSLDVDQILAADHSGGVRVAPLLIYLRDVSIAEPGFWFGYGFGGIEHLFQGQISGVGDDNSGAGFLPGFVVVYGVLAFAFFAWIFALRQVNRTTLPLIAFWAIFMTSSALNTQVFWYGLIVIQIAWAASRDVVRSSASVKP
jgi:hypothetical protein